MAYRIHMAVRLANPHPVGAFTEKTRDWFLSAVSIFEEKSSKSTVNRKRIEVCRENITKERIILTLVSEADISASPGRALSHLSRILIDETIPGYDSFYTNNIYFQRLFSTTVIEEGPVKEISDVDMVKALVSYLGEPKSTMPERKKTAIKNIKNILVESGFFVEDAN